MTSSVVGPSERLFVDRLARQRLVVTLACVAASSFDLALRVGAYPGLASFVGSGLLATVVLEVARRSRRLATPHESAAAVFLSGLVAILIAPAWAAAVDPGSRLEEMPWGPVVAWAILWPAVGAVIAAQGRAIEQGRRALEQAGREKTDAAEAGRRELAVTLGSLEQHLETFAPLLRALERERDARTNDRVHVAEAARALGPLVASSVDEAGGLVARIESLRCSIEVLRGGAMALEERDGDLAQHVESAARGLVAIVQASRAISDRMAPIAEASRDATASLTELVEATGSVGGAVDSIRGVSKELVARAELGRTRFAETLAGIESIRSATGTAESIIRALDARTREIGGILDVIDEVGDQTSLLALNAAIIAAQAGEHGRSFSVVAEEIRDLADRVLVGTKEIGGLIRSVQLESGRAIGAIEAGSQSVASGVALAAEVGRTLEELAWASRATGTRIDAAATSVEQQSRVLERVVESSRRLGATVREVESADVERARNQALVSESMIGSRDAAADLRSLIQDQTTGLARVDGELGFALEAARGLGVALEDPKLAGRGVLESIESRAGAVASSGTTVDPLIAAVESLRAEMRARRPGSARSESIPARPSESTRAKGESS